MSPLVPALAGALMVAGLIGIVVGLRPAPTAVQPARGPARLLTWWARVPPVVRLWALAGLAVGLLAFLVTGWLLALVVPPLAAVGLPLLLGPPPDAARIDRLEAMAEWTRNLAGVLVAGVGLEQAIMATQKAAPAAIRTEITQLVGRLRGRWQTEEALRAFADDLNDATGDLIAAYLILGARRRGPGLAAVLTALAESVADDVTARRQIEADRAKPRGALRLTTLFTAGTLTMFAATGVLAPYGSPTGQAVLALLLGIYVLALVWMRKLSASPAIPRILNSADGRAQS